ncbi:MAG: amidohydrolase family protein [Verrucomicrobiia bacterium]
MILRARWVVDRQLRLVHGGRVSLPGKTGVLDLGDCVLMPGLVNAHCHLDYTAMRGKIPKARGFAQWIESIGRAKRQWGARDYRDSIMTGMREALASGTTAMVNWICLPAALPSRGVPPMRVWWLWEQIAYRPGSAPDKAGWSAWRRRVRGKGRAWKAGIAPHAPYTCTGEILRAAAAWSGSARFPWSIHVAESQDEWRMFREARGGLFHFMRGMGRAMTDCDGRTPLAAAWDAVYASRAPVLLVHANRLSREDLARLGAAVHRGRPIAVVHCPRSTKRLGHPPFPLRALHAAGVPVVLGTDSLASNNDLSMFAEMRALDGAQTGLRPHEILAMATAGAAQAVGAGKSWGRWKDWIAIPCRAEREAGAWEAILAHEGPVSWAMVDGKAARI